MKTFITTLLLTLFPLVACADRVLLGVFPGNDSPWGVSHTLGITPTLLGKVEDIPGVDNGFAVGGLLATPDGFIAGGWYYPGQELVNLITVKAGNEWAAYCVRPPCEEIPFSKRSFLASSRVSRGYWNTSALGWKGASHISGWSVDCVHAPAPSSFALVLCGLIPIAVIVLLARRAAP